MKAFLELPAGRFWRFRSRARISCDRMGSCSSHHSPGEVQDACATLGQDVRCAVVRRRRDNPGAVDLACRSGGRAVGDLRRADRALAAAEPDLGDPVKDLYIANMDPDDNIDDLLEGGHASRDAPRPEAWDHRPANMGRLDALLAAVVPADDKERADLALMLAQCSLLPEPLSRSQPAAHFTGSAVVTDGRRVALVRHRKLGRWLQPGGHADPVDRDDLLATALREAAEETGCPVAPHPSAPRPLDVDVHPIPSRGTEPAHLHLDVRFLVLTDRPEALRADLDESSAVRWFELDEAIHRAGTPEMKRLLTKVRTVLGI